jgi:hypothetical protein
MDDACDASVVLDYQASLRGGILAVYLEGDGGAQVETTRGVGRYRPWHY